MDRQGGDGAPRPRHRRARKSGRGPLPRGAREIAEEELRRAAVADIGDWFRFEIGGGIDIGNHSVRLSVNATIGATTWVEFHVDLVGSDLRMTGQPEDVPPLARGVIPEVGQRGYRAYPLVDHIADKVAATYERHGEERRPSTRYRDLVDLVAIVTTASVGAASQRAALTSEFDRRGLTLPTSFVVPDRALWEPGYRAEARRSLLDTAQTLDEALLVVRPFIDPLLDAAPRGRGSPDRDGGAEGRPSACGPGGDCGRHQGRGGHVSERWAAYSIEGPLAGVRARRPASRGSPGRRACRPAF